MTLRLTRLSLRDFRSYDSFELPDIGGLTVLVGPNAVGKTNVIEAVQLMTALTSFRHATIEQMIRRGAPRSLIEATVEDDRRLLEFALTMEDHARRYKLNGKAKRPVDLRGMVPSIVFTPDDLDLVKGSAGNRRRAVDALGSQVNANYDVILRDYERVLRHKNRLLKDEASDALVDSIDEMLVTCGAQLTCYRHALLDRLMPHMIASYEGISGKREKLNCVFTPSWEVKTPSGSGPCVEVAYMRDSVRPHMIASYEGISGKREKLNCVFTPSWEVKTPSGSGPCVEVAYMRDSVREALSRALGERRAEERARKRALVGPHADGISFMLDDMDASCFGSQGQQRSIVLSCKIAEARIVEEVLDVKPLLLLDDVMSELDGARREALVAFIAEDVQTIVTTANLAYFDAGMLARADIVELSRS